MNEPRTQQEPSMEEILASIRRIISEDGAKDAPEPEPEPEPEAASLVEPPRPASEPPRLALEPVAAPSPADDDILELTEVAEDDFEPPPEPVPPRRFEPPQREPSVEELLVEPASVRRGDGLVSEPVAEATRAAFSRLVEEPSRFVLSGTTPIGSGRTVEDIVRELLRPMLRDWLDANLPGMVERIVEREVESIGRRVGRR